MESVPGRATLVILVFATLISGCMGTSKRPTTTTISSKLSTPVATLLGNGIGAVHFGESQSEAMAIFDRLFGKPTAANTLKDREDCEIDAIKRWGEVTAFFSQSEFVGYGAVGSQTRYTPQGFPVFNGKGGNGHEAQTQLGLRVGDTLAVAQNLYGSAVMTSTAQGGSWTVTTADGVLHGYLSGEVDRHTPYQLLVVSIGAGDFGCPGAWP